MRRWSHPAPVFCPFWDADAPRGRVAAYCTWTNVDDSPHQFTVQGETTLRTPVILKGQSISLTFEHAGSYGYICGLHPAMKGQIEVTK